MRRCDLQYRCSASQTGRRYCAVDSIHHHFLDVALDEPLSKRAQLDGLVPTFRTFKVVVTLDLDISHRDAQHLLVHVNPRDVARHRPLLVGAESVPRRINRGRELSSGENPATLNYSVNSRTLRVEQLLGLNCSMANLDLAAPSAAILPKR
jgi:hypothetical protein